MITELKKHDDGIFEIVANGEMTLDDLAKLREFLDEIIAECKSGCCKLFGCVNLNNVPVPSTEFFQKDLGLMDKYKGYIGGMAFVGDAEWEKAWGAFLANLTSAKVKFFPSDEKKQACIWLKKIALC